MKKWVGLLILLLGPCSLLWGQGIIGNGQVQYVWAAPAGACGQNNQQQDVVGAGTIWMSNIIAPVRSIYRWRGAIEEAREHWIVIKTRKELYSMVERRVRELHSYEVPEILALTPSAGSTAYLEWILASTSGATAPRRRAARPS